MGVRLDRDGYNWVVKYTSGMIKENHLRLEAPGLDHDETNMIRGEIRAMRRMDEEALRAIETGREI